MNKQEFVSMSHNKGLRLRTINGDIVTLLGIIGNDCIVDLYGNEVKYNLSDLLVLVRPLSSMVDSVEYNDKLITPIFELSNFIRKAGNPYDRCEELIDGVFIAYYSTDKSNIFGYDSNTNSFFGASGGKSISIAEQLSLFQMMVDMHLDVAKLIQKGEGLNINKL